MIDRTTHDSDRELTTLVEAKRVDVERYLRSTTGRSKLLVNLNIAAGSIAAVLTAAPALGGKPLSDWLGETLTLSTPAWRILCALACACSVIATIATQMRASHHYEDRIAKAHELKAALEVLELELRCGTLDREHAAERFSRCITDSSTIQME
jgi:hypothetical protein